MDRARTVMLQRTHRSRCKCLHRASARNCPRPAPPHRLAGACSRRVSSRSTTRNRRRPGRGSQALRAELARRGLSGFILPRADRHQNEYVPPSEERLAWLTGFTGSAGIDDRAGGPRRAVRRRPLHAAGAASRSTPSVFTIVPIAETPPDTWLEQNLPPARKLGYDPWLHTVDGAERLARACTNAGATLVPAEPNPVDAIWTDRPAPPLGAVTLHDLRYAGEYAERQAQPHPRRDREPARRRAGDLRSARGGLDLQHPRLRRRAHAAAARLRHRAAGGHGRRSTSTARKLSNAVRHKLEEIAEVREPARLHPRAHRARRPRNAPCGSTRRPRADALAAHRHRRRRQGDARRRSDRADEGGEEPGRDRGRARGASARRRGDDALPRLVRPRGAERRAHRDRRGRGAGKLPPRHRPAQGRVVPDHLRRRTGRRHRALSRDARDQPHDRSRASCS